MRAKLSGLMPDAPHPSPAPKEPQSGMDGCMSRIRQFRRPRGPRSPGAAKLSKEADLKVGEKATEIVDSLLEGTLKGNGTCASLLVSLAEGADFTGNAENARRILSLAEAWASEPQWIDEQTEAEAETSSGILEPEDLVEPLLLPATCPTPPPDPPTPS